MSDRRKREESGIRNLDQTERNLKKDELYYYISSYWIKDWNSFIQGGNYFHFTFLFIYFCFIRFYNNK